MKERLTRNVGMKIISLIIAVFLWIIINGLTDPITTEVIEDIPVKLVNEEAMDSVGKIFEVVSGETISVKVRTKRSVAEQLDAEDFSAVADVVKMTEMNAVEIVVSCIGYDETEVEILEKRTEDGTAMMMLSLEDSDTKSFAVTVVPDGAVAPGHCITESIVSPNLLTITGSKTQIAKIAKIAVLVNVNGASDSFVQTGTPIVYDENGNVIESAKLSLSSEQVQVSMTLLPTKQITINVTPKGTPFYNYDCNGIEYAPHTVQIAGKRRDLDRIFQLDLICDIDNARADVETELNIKDALNELYGDKYILVEDIDKVSVKADIERMESKDISVFTGAIELRDLPENLKAEFKDVTVNLRAMAVPELLEKVSAASLKPYIDCSEYKQPGIYYAVIRAQETERVEVKLTTIEVTISEAEAANLPAEQTTENTGE